jgi:iron complex transport system substrate-binding protein
MPIDRRVLLGQLAAFSLVPGTARADTVTDGAGRSVPIPARVTKVFAAGPTAAVLLYTLAPDLVTGWPRANPAAACEFMLPDICARPQIGRITGGGNTINTEALLNMAPDLILDYGSLNNTFVSLADRVQQQTGIPYALLDGRFSQTEAVYRTLGRLTHREREAEPLAAYVTRTIGAIRERVARIPAEQRPRIYHARGPSGLNTPAPGSINLDPFELLGARNVAQEGRTGFTVSLEQVLLWDPDVIITIEQQFFDAARADPNWKAVKAVRQGRIYLAPELPFGWMDFPPSVNRLVGLWWLAKMLYPNEFTDDLKPLVREFYSLFYHVDISDAQAARLLRE